MRKREKIKAQEKNDQSTLTEQFKIETQMFSVIVINFTNNEEN